MEGYALKGNVVTRAGVLENSFVSVSGGKIVRVGGEPVPGYEVTESGCYIAPGLDVYKRQRYGCTVLGRA